MIFSCSSVFNCKGCRLNAVKPTAVPRVSIPLSRMPAKKVVMDLEALRRRGEEELAKN
jgi:hypothetical protein